MTQGTEYTRRFECSAPIRIADCGGWTDTWFARHGAVCAITVSPRVTVRLELTPATVANPAVRISAVNYATEYDYRPGSPFGAHPLLEAAINTIGIPDRSAARITVSSGVAPGAATGTSAAVAVALIGALRAARGLDTTPDILARDAFHLEYDVLGRQCGVQDHYCSAYGGILHLAITDFPRTEVTTLAPPAQIVWELERRLLLLTLGAPHDSHTLHRAVIAELEHEGPGARRLEVLRHAAAHMREALLAGDMADLGAVFDENTHAQAALHPALLSDAARRIMDLARTHGALGCKVNGAGGEGGSMTILCGDDPAQRTALVAAARFAAPGAEEVPVRISSGGAAIRELS